MTSVTSQAVAHFGERHQMQIAIGELCELATALSRYATQGRDGALENVLEEIADVKICVEQLEIIFSKYADDIALIDQIKRDRLQKLITEQHTSAERAHFKWKRHIRSLPE